ncbi:MAG: ParB/RepB/Spo0J family partition protein [Bryobacterales bacterium]|nr:ParB/RepB/Spo0J family partition protein [Bryobacterales bacterium]
MPPKPPKAKRPALGRGLSAILPPPPAPEAGSETVLQVSVAKIDPNPAQPRQHFGEESLQQLAASIRADGVLQPVLVRPDGERYTLIVGERRLRAARRAGLDSVPAIVRDIAADRLLEVTLIENIQRQDLNPIEIALALERMLSDLHLLQHELAERTGMSRSSVANHLRLLKLPTRVLAEVRDGNLRMGHARALLSLDTDAQKEALAERAVAEGMSVRQVEEAVRRVLKPAKPKPRKPLDPNVSAALEELERVLQAPVRLRGTPEKGRLEIRYRSAEELAAIYDRVVGE